MGGWQTIWKLKNGIKIPHLTWGMGGQPRCGKLCKFCIHLNIDVRGPAMTLEVLSELRLVEVRKMKMRVQDINMVCHSRAGTGTW